MTQPQSQGVPPNLYRVLKGALKAPMECPFPTKSAATTMRHRLYSARRRLARQGDPLSAAFDTLSITAPAERELADGTKQWFFRIGESVLNDTLEKALEEHCAKHGIDPMSLDPVANFDPQPSIPLAPTQVRDDWMPVRSAHERIAPGDVIDDILGSGKKKDGEQ